MEAIAHIFKLNQNKQIFKCHFLVILFFFNLFMISLVELFIFFVYHFMIHKILNMT